MKAIELAVAGSYIAWRLRWSAQPFVRAYGQWVNEYIIPIADGFNARAEAFQQETYDRLSSEAPFDPETYSGDGSEFAEQAFDAGLSFYQTLSGLYQANLNLLTAGLFHLIEQQLANITHDGAIEIAVADTQLGTVTKYYGEHFGLDLSTFNSWSVIQEMRLVANSIKHGEGRSAEELRKIHPELFQYPALRRKDEHIAGFSQFRLDMPLAGDGLYVTALDFRCYENAANAFFDFISEYFNKNCEAYFPIP